VVLLGMIIPAILDILELKGYHVPALIPMILVLFGSLMLRFLIAYAGQASRYLY
jgi:formate-dependent nitrite reductase membrane component NrfD